MGKVKAKRPTGNTAALAAIERRKAAAEPKIQSKDRRHVNEGRKAQIPVAIDRRKSERGSASDGVKSTRRPANATTLTRKSRS